MEPPRVENYPDRSYLLDHPAQLRMNEISQRFLRRIKFWIAGGLIGFFSLIVFKRILQWELPSNLVWIFLIGFFLAPVMFFWPTPRPQCSTCGKKMRREWIHLGRGGGDESEFMACHTCKRYADTHKSVGG